MGRSVSHAEYSKHITYTHLEYLGDEWADRDQWQDFIEGLRNQIKELFPSMYECNEWVGREDYAIMENRYARIGVSEYDGMVSIWMQPIDLETGHGDDERLVGIQESWIDKARDKHISLGNLKRQGGFSDGTSLYMPAM